MDIIKHKQELLMLSGQKGKNTLNMVVYFIQVVHVVWSLYMYTGTLVNILLKCSGLISIAVSVGQKLAKLVVYNDG